MWRFEDTSHSRDWPHGFRRLLMPTFVSVKGKVFVTFSRSKRIPQAIKENYRKRRPDTVDENTTNHQHIDFFDRGSLEGIRNNYALAKSVRLVWNDILIRQFPNRQFCLFVSNEYDLNTEEDSEDDEAVVTDQAVSTTLRLWTRDPRTDEEFGASYRLKDLDPQKAIWYGQWLYKMDVGVLDLVEVCRLMQEGRTTRMRLGAIKNRLQNIGKCRHTK